MHGAAVRRGGGLAKSLMMAFETPSTMDAVPAVLCERCWRMFFATACGRTARYRE